MALMTAGDGSVMGMVGRVRQVTNKGAKMETRIEDRGLILFVSSSTPWGAVGSCGELWGAGRVGRE